MPIQTGILPAGSTLTVDCSIGETAIISYQDGDIGVVDNGHAKTTGRTIGPFANDAAYSIEYTGWPKVFTTSTGGAITTISLPLPDPASLPVGRVINVDGNPALTDGEDIIDLVVDESLIRHTQTRLNNFYLTAIAVAICACFTAKGTPVVIVRGHDSACSWSTREPSNCGSISSM